MLVSKAIERIRERINDEYDTGYSDTILMDYINDAIKYLASALIQRNDPIVVNEMTVTKATPATVPANFVRFAGGFPVKRKQDKFYVTDDSTSVLIKYFYIPPEVTSLSGSLPFDDDVYHTLIIKLASIYAINQHEYNVNQDEQLKSQLEQLLIQALGAVT